MTVLPEEAHYYNSAPAQTPAAGATVAAGGGARAAAGGGGPVVAKSKGAKGKKEDKAAAAAVAATDAAKEAAPVDVSFTVQAIRTFDNVAFFASGISSNGTVADLKKAIALEWKSFRPEGMQLHHIAPVAGAAPLTLVTATAANSSVLHLR